MNLYQKSSGSIFHLQNLLRSFLHSNTPFYLSYLSWPTGLSYRFGSVVCLSSINSSFYLKCKLRIISIVKLANILLTLSGRLLEICMFQNYFAKAPFPYCVIYSIGRINELRVTTLKSISTLIPYTVLTHKTVKYTQMV